jgi:hypothetical protein
MSGQPPITRIIGRNPDELLTPILEDLDMRITWVERQTRVLAGAQSVIAVRDASQLWPNPEGPQWAYVISEATWYQSVAQAGGETAWTDNGSVPPGY